MRVCVLFYMLCLQMAVNGHSGNVGGEVVISCVTSGIIHHSMTSAVCIKVKSKNVHR